MKASRNLFDHEGGNDHAFDEALISNMVAALTEIGVKRQAVEVT
jgi:hypothetical protein